VDYLADEVYWLSTSPSVVANSTLSILLAVSSESILGNGTHFDNDARENGCSESGIPVTEPGQHNTVPGVVNGAVLQARDVIASTIIMQSTGRPSVLVPRQFPPAHPVWVNRNQELVLLDRLAAKPVPTRVVLTGMGGVGKTELAARWLIGQRASHPDGELYADLSVSFDGRPPSPQHVLAGWLRALGVPPGKLPADFAVLTALYRSLTAEKSHLVLVDNAFSAALVRPLIPASPTSTIVATSRYRLRGLVMDGFQTVDLGCFEPGAGGLLLDAFLSEPTPPDQRGELETLASRCHGHPLALVIAGTVLSTNPYRSPADLITYLDTDHGSTLTLRADEASVGGLLDMSYDNLDPGTARLYRLLASHPGAEFAADPFAAALDLPPVEVEERLTRLLDANLITLVADARYRQHDLLREHATTLAEQHDDPTYRRAALRSMIEWYLRRTAAADMAINPRSRRFSPVYEHLDTEPFSTSEDALDWFAVERVNVLASQYLAAQHGWDGLVFQLAEVVWNPLRPSYFADDLVDTQELGVAAAQRCRHVLEPVFLARLGFGETNRAHHETAITACTSAIERATTFGDSWVQSATLSTRARAFTAAGQPRAALEDLGAALRLDEQRGDRRSIALRHRRIGQAYAHPEIADFLQAIWHFREAATAMEALNDETAHARVVTYLAEAHVAARQPDAALFTLRQVENALASCGSLRYRGLAYTVMGRAHAQLGNTANADRCYRKALELYVDAGPGAAANREAVVLLQKELGDAVTQESREDNADQEKTEG
jgi:tetratricopeptide (TPR) repeat protein